MSRPFLILGCFILAYSLTITITASSVASVATSFSQNVMYAEYVTTTQTCNVPSYCDQAKDAARNILANIVCEPRCVINYFYCKRDFLIILDSSGSINLTQYDQAKRDLAWIATNLCGNFGSDLRVAGMQFSTIPVEEFDFDDHLSKPALHNAVLGMGRQGGITRTFLALDFARQVMFTVANGMRLRSYKQALIITDGSSNGAPTGMNAEQMSIDAATLLKASGVELFALTIGSYLDINEIRSYVSDPVDDHVFSVGSVEELSDLRAEVEADPPCPPAWYPNPLDLEPHDDA